MISTRDYTIIIPCIKFEDCEFTLKKIREQYKNIKIIVCLNRISKKNKKKRMLDLL